MTETTTGPDPQVVAWMRGYIGRLPGTGGALALHFKERDGRVLLVEYLDGELPWQVARRDHLAATLPTIDTTEEG